MAGWRRLVHRSQRVDAVLGMIGHCAFFLCCAAGPASADFSPETPHWIWVDQGETKGVSAVSFRREFECAERLIEAKLRVLADFHDAEIYVNQTLAVRVESYDPITEVDITRYLATGKNVVTIRSFRVVGPPALAVELRLVFADNRTRTLYSDSSWQTAVDLRSNAVDRDSTETPWRAAIERGRVSPATWGTMGRPLHISGLDDYTQWKRALGATDTAVPSKFLVADGFQIERLRVARPSEGSWISLTFDPQGRLIVSKEKKGLLRMTLSADHNSVDRVEVINDSLEECRGLLFAHGSLYANANNSKGLYRLRDTDGDDRFDEVRLLMQSAGGVGHGRNDLALGPDGRIYTIHGDSVTLPAHADDRTSPLRKLEPIGRTGMGHWLALSANGDDAVLLAVGLRNPYGIACSPDGEWFTYDADAEHDMGAPWYRPTRIRHLVSGADYGWRAVTGRWPPYYPDHAGNPPSNLDVGKGSPTAVCFATNSPFPSPYRQALFVLDWAYGRILAIHLTPRGASYLAQGETFVKGRPFNVTDLAFGPGGAMYVITGGRATQSALYRIRFTGKLRLENLAAGHERDVYVFSAKARRHRRALEAFHTPHAAGGIEAVWPSLASADPWIRQAARVALEHQPVQSWQRQALEEPRSLAAATALMALARAAGKETLPKIVARLNDLFASPLRRSEKAAALRAYEICLERLDSPDETLIHRTITVLDAAYPDASFQINRDLSRLLVQLGSESVVAKTVSLLSETESQSEKLHYLFVLRNVREGWTPASRQTYFRELQQAQHYVGGAGMPQFIRQIADESLAGLPDREADRWRKLLEQPDEGAEAEAAFAQRKLVRHWTLRELVPQLESVRETFDPQRGRELFHAVLCSRCHRLGGEGHPIGPDLTSVASRFSRTDILESILQPSKVVAETYRTDLIRLKDGRVLSGRIVLEGDYRSPELRIATDPLHPLTWTTVPKSEIEAHRKSSVSMMPEGLLDTLTPADIWQLLGFLESGGSRGD